MTEPAKIILSQSQVCKIKMQEQNFLGVLVISVQVWTKVPQSYHCELWFERLTHIGLDWIGLAQSYWAPPIYQNRY